MCKEFIESLFSASQFLGAVVIFRVSLRTPTGQIKSQQTGQFKLSGGKKVKCIVYIHLFKIYI